MTTTQRITQALEITYWQYDYIRDLFFLEWCKKYAWQMRIPLKALTVHDGLRNWYHDQWQLMVEKKFSYNYGDFFSKADPLTLQSVMYEYAVNILDNYPVTLLKMIKDESTIEVAQRV